MTPRYQLAVSVALARLLLPSNPYEMLSSAERQRLMDNLREMQRVRRQGEDAARRIPLG